ncbi:retrotransposon protein, putative, ty1-copia subclass [Tanacetum coccineum]
MGRLYFLDTRTFGVWSKLNNSCCGSFSLQSNSHDKAAAYGDGWHALKICTYNAINAHRLPLAPLVYTLVRPPMTTTVIMLSVDDKLPFLEQPIPVMPVPPDGQILHPNVLATHSAWVKASKGFANYNMHRMGKIMTELHVMLKLHEKTLPKKDVVAPALHAIRAGKITPPPKKDNLVKDVSCHQYNDVGHLKQNCLQYIAELLKNKKLSQGASTSGIFITKLCTFPNNTWVYDTGCGTYICITTHGLRGSRKLNPGALSLYVGDGHRAAVKAIGSYHLCLPNVLVLVLHNYHYAPSITGRIILVSRLYDDGFINYFEDNTVSVSRNNVIYLSVVPRNGIFEIDLSNSNTNDSSLYIVSNKRAKINLDSTLLWHYRLRQFLDHLKEHGIIAHRTPHYTPQHNDMSERRNRTLLDMVRSMMSQTTLPKSFWDYALESAARILNMVPTKKAKKTPYEVWHGKAPKQSYLKVWGCKALFK